MIETNIYLELTRQFNTGRLRAVISSGQAVVLHRVAIMSKDGDWILREDTETTGHVLKTLAERGAHYRFSAPLDPRWLRGGWSSHFEFQAGPLRVRTDFVTRPPRISPPELKKLWKEQEGKDPPFVGLKHLAEIKKTNREKDYIIIGELARLMTNPSHQLLYSRSARDLIALAEEHPRLTAAVARQRPLLKTIAGGREELEKALDAERRLLMRENEQRLEVYARAAERWRTAWPDIERQLVGRSLLEAHDILVKHAEKLLPRQPLRRRQ